MHQIDCPLTSIPLLNEIRLISEIRKTPHPFEIINCIELRKVVNL